MPVTRRAVLEELARRSTADLEETTTPEALAVALETDVWTVASRLHSLVECELARTTGNGRVRVTITGEELLELDVDGAVVLRPSANDQDRR